MIMTRKKIRNIYLPLLFPAAVMFAANIRAESEQGFHIYPYPNNRTTNGVTLIWETTASGPSLPEYGLEGDYGKQVSINDNVKLHRVRAGSEVRENTFRPAPAREWPTCLNPALYGQYGAFSKKYPGNLVKGKANACYIADR